MCQKINYYIMIYKECGKNLSQKITLRISGK